MLTDAEIRKMPPAPAGGRVEKIDSGYDGAGALYIVVQPTGARSWAFRYSHNGKARKLTIGRYPRIGLADARKEARRLGVEVEHGADPCADKIAVKAAAGAPVVLTVAMVADLFVKQHTAKKNGERWSKEVRRIIAKDILPAIGHKPAATVTKADVRDLRDKIADGDGKGRAPAPIQSNRALSVMAKMFRWALSEDYVSADPTAGLAKRGAETKRGRVLSDDELARVWRAASELEYPFGPAVRLLVLTGARREEIAALKWSEIGTAKWRDAIARTEGEVPALLLPASRAKNKLEHITPLSAAAMVVLDSVPRIGHGDLVFTTNGVTPVSGWSRAKAQIDRLSGVTGWVLHDLRRCISTWMNESGTDPHIAEAVLGHVVKGVGGVYNKASYLREKAEALDLWAKHVEEIAR